MIGESQKREREREQPATKKDKAGCKLTFIMSKVTTLTSNT